MKGKNPDCPCGSGAKYAACCRPFHRGEAAPPDPERLMRSRFAAFAQGEVGYLYDTLDPEHPERQRPREEELADLRRNRQGMRFAKLTVLDTATEGDAGTVLFHAEIYEAGKERSFLERSRFRRHPEGWRYLSGTPFPFRSGDPRLEGLTLAGYDALTAGSAG